MLWASAFILGLAGSLHCGVMCGPIVLATSTRHSTGASAFLFRQMAYNTGRIITYLFIGAVAGVISTGLYLVGMQQALSILSGIVILGLYFGPMISRKLKPNNSYVLLISTILKKKFGPYLRAQNVTSKFITGLINGLLPCGLVYVAAAGALGTGSFGGALLFMLLFGLGTVPMMLGISIFRTFIFNIQSLRPTRIIPIFVATISILFILRGLNLNIPYMSPMLTNEDPSGMTICE